MAELVKVEQQDRVAIVTLDHPPVNALSQQLLEELEEIYDELDRGDDVRVIVLRGEGEKAFVAGADIAVLSKLDPIGAAANSARGQRLTELIEGLGKPVIAAINGFALGGGLEMALACHVRIAVEGARLGQPEVKLGLITGYGGSQRLARIVGKGRALEIMLTGDPVEAAEAHRIGLVNRVVKREALVAEAEALARKMAAAGPLAVQYTLEAVNRGLEMSQAEGLALEASLFGLCFATQDMKEGTSAFLQKRPANFQGK
jgi:enoyl-CoA hydratase/carnithine racemase